MLSVVRAEMYANNDMYADFTEHERNLFSSVIDTKKQNWVLGRLAAKRAVECYGTLRGYNGIAYHNIEIHSGTGQPPTFTIKHNLRDTRTLEKESRLSLAHSDGVAVAQVINSRAGKRVGVDIEKIRSFDEATIHAFTTDREYESHMSLDPFQRDRDATLRWCLKEAYLKAIGTGLRVHPRKVEAIFNSKKPENVSFTFAGKQVPVKVRWTIVDELYILVSVIL